MMPPLRGRTVASRAWALCFVVVLGACSEKIYAPPEPPVAVRRGDEAFRYEKYGEAITAYRTYLDENHTHDDYAASVLYKMALAEYRLGRYRATIEALDELGQRYPRGRWVQVDALRGDAERAQGNLMVALQAWDAGWKVANESDRAKLRQRIEAVARQLNDVELARARRLVTTDEVGALLDRQIAARQPPPLLEPVPDIAEETTPRTAETDLAAPTIVEEPAREVPRRPAESVASAPAYPDSRSERSQETPALEPPGGTEPQTIPEPLAATEPQTLPEPVAGTQPQGRTEPQTLPGPLAGTQPQAIPEAPRRTEPQTIPEPPFPAHVVGGVAHVGCLLPLSGTEQATGERVLRGIRLALDGQNERLIIKDISGDKETAVERFEELARDPSVLIVIGYLGDAAGAVAQRAEQSQLPLIRLSDRVGRHGQFVLQTGITQSEQIATLLDYTMHRVRLRRFGVVYPSDAYGKQSLANFQTEVKRRGGTVVGHVAYAPDATSFAAQAATIRKWRDVSNLEAIFLPGRAKTAATLDGFLQREAPDVMLLGVGQWATLADHGSDRRLSGLVFTDTFYPESARPATREFVARYHNAYGGEPGALEAEGYDAATLIVDGFAAGARTRTSMLRRLYAFGRLDGAAGEISMTPNGLQRTAFLLQLSDGQLRELLTTSRQESPVALAALEPQPAEPAVSEPVQPESSRIVPEPAPPADRGEALLAPGDVGKAPDARVACLLPLTGPDRAYGKRALAGLRLAFADEPHRLLVRDTGGDPNSSVEWLRKLQDVPNVVAVIGPLRSSEAEATAPLAERDRIPLLLLSQKEGLAGRFVFQVAMTRTQEIELLVRYAVNVLKLRRFGVVYPNDTYGSTFARAFKRQAISEAASVVGMHAYVPGAPKVAPALAAVQGWQQAGLDAVFLPDAAVTAAGLAAQIRHAIPGIALLGTESWNDVKTLTDAGSAIDGAIFADAFFANSSRQSTREFVERFRRDSGQSPTVFEAQAFDAGMAVRWAIAKGAISREQIVEQLNVLGNFAAAGELHASPNGFERSLSILRYQNGKVEEVSVTGLES